jgi:hypothetical protein
MKRIVSFISLAVILISQISFGINNIYAIENVEKEDAEIKSFIHNAVQIILEHDRNNEYVAETTKKKFSNNEDNSIKKESRENSSRDNEASFSDTAFQTCRLIIKASKTPNKLNSTGMASGFRDWYIIQFENEENAKSAYEYYLSKDEIIKVTPDIVHKKAYYNETENIIDDAAKSDNLKDVTSRLNSWGSINTGLYDIKDYIESTVSAPQEIIVGLIDSGINYNLEYFNNRIIRTYANYSGTGDENDEMDNEGHGTMVGSIIVDNTPSNVKIAAYVDGGLIGTESEEALAVLDAVNDEVDILNCSFGQSNESGLLGEVLYYAHEKDIPVVAAGGNMSENIRIDEASWPACDEKSVSVGGLSYTGMPASWSAYGYGMDLLAPCENLPTLSKNDSIKNMSGTSFSAPLVVSLFTQLMTMYPEMSNEEIERRIKATADSTDLFYDCGLFGYGVIDAVGASGINRLNTPVYDKASGKYLDEISVEITADPGAEIYYTLDGSYPSKEDGILYTAPVSISDDCPYLKAVAYKEGTMRSEMAKSLYRLQRQGTDDMFIISAGGQILSYTGDVFDLVIPERINGITVTGIARNVFSESALAGVSFPDTLSEISEYAFENNRSLMLADGKNIETIGQYAFNNCKSLTLIDFPSVESVGSNSFSSCAALPGIVFPECKEMGFSSFSGCYSMRYAYLPEVTVFKGQVFRGATMLTDIYLPELKELTWTALNPGDFAYCDICDVLDLPKVKATQNGTFSSAYLKRMEFSQIQSIHRLNMLGIHKMDTDNKLVSLVLPSTLESVQGITEGTIYNVYGTRGTYAEQWANENEFEFIEITPETAVITDLPDEFYDYMRYLYADVVGFNRTYQWYGSYSNRNTGGTPIEGANERKFVPKDNEQYPFYYCVVTSTDVGYDPIEIRTGASRYMEFSGEIPPADYSALDKILSTIPEDLSIYTGDSVAVLNSIIESIDYNLDASEQDTVDGYVEAISSAIEALYLEPIITISNTKVVRGQKLIWNVTTPKNVVWLQFVGTDENGNTYTAYYKYSNYNKETTEASVTDIDNLRIWNIPMVFNYAGTNLTNKQNWKIEYKVSGSSEWKTVRVSDGLGGKKDYLQDILVGKNQEVLIPPTPHYSKYELISVLPSSKTVSKGDTGTFTVTTTDDVSKIRIGYVNPDTGKAKTATYQTISTNVLSHDNSDGLSVWVIKYKFSSPADNDAFFVQCRGSNWGKSEAVEVEVE